MTALSDKTIKAMIDDGLKIVDPFDSAGFPGNPFLMEM